MTPSKKNSENEQRKVSSFLHVHNRLIMRSQSKKYLEGQGIVSYADQLLIQKKAVKIEHK